jgi:pimeloyl-ACP methyl ester carboxylesterase
VIVEGDGVAIDTKDWGGGDIPLLLTHGAFFFKETLDGLVPLLLPTFRVITFDMRNHGASGEGPWEWPAVTADVEAVRRAYGLEHPVVAGHSLGGMVAAMYATDYPVCRAAVNIDGQGKGKPEHYAGMTEAEVRTGWAALDEEQKSTLAGVDKPRLTEMLAVLDDLDLFPVWRATPCPLLIFNCVADDPMYAGRGEQFGALMRAYRSGLGAALADLARERPSIRIETSDKTHVSVITEPHAAADAITKFVTGLD